MSVKRLSERGNCCRLFFFRLVGSWFHSLVAHTQKVLPPSVSRLKQGRRDLIYYNDQFVSVGLH